MLASRPPCPSFGTPPPPLPSFRRSLCSVGTPAASLGTVERFFVALCRVPFLRERVEHLTFKLQFPLLAADIAQRIDTLAAALGSAQDLRQNVHAYACAFMRACVGAPRCGYFF